MNKKTAEKIFEEVRTLPENMAREVLDFVGYLKTKRAAQPKTEAADMSEFDQFRAVFERGETTEPEREINLALFRKYRGLYDGKFNRDELYDRPCLR